MKWPTIAQVCDWVKKSWDVNTEIIVKSFKKCGISNALDGIEDDALFEDSDDSSSDSSSSSYNEFSGFDND